MLVAVQSFGSIWTARGASAGCAGMNLARRGAYYNTSGVLAGEQIAEPVVHLRPRSRG